MDTNNHDHQSLAKTCHLAACRTCFQSGLLPVLDLGSMPPSDRLLRPEDRDKEERRFPLQVAYCPNCSLVQILETVDPQYLFGEDYLYFSSFSQHLLQHSKDSAHDIIERKHLGSDSLVVELASNDGYLLKNFVENHIPVLGIDPAPKQAQVANESNIPTRNAFFSNELAKTLKSEDLQADVIIANNVLAHVADVHSFVSGIHTLLKDEGMASIEVPYIKELVDHLEFDTIYHEHLCYFSMTSLDRLLRKHQLFINDFKSLSIHGGSLRLYVSKKDTATQAVTARLNDEANNSVANYDYYKDFTHRVESARTELRTLIQQLKSEGHRIAAYGAAAKGSILLNASGLRAPEIEYVVDRNEHKHGFFMPGSKLEIHPTAKLVEDAPDYTLMLPWNFKDEIISQQAEYLANGGKFIIPIPELKIITE